MVRRLVSLRAQRERANSGSAPINTFQELLTHHLATQQIVVIQTHHLSTQQIVVIQTHHL
jgi:hypothetical protein